MTAAARTIDPNRRDWSLHSGERQTAPTYHEVRANHRVRYEWAAATLGQRPGQCGLDAFCGTGYGTQLLAHRTGAAVTGIDGSREAIDFARAHFDHSLVTWRAQQFPFCINLCVNPGRFDFVVSIESLEHVEDADAFFDALAGSLTPGGTLLLSTPNETLCPLAQFRNPYHVRHFTRDEIMGMAARNGLTLVAWLGQFLTPYRRGDRATPRSADDSALAPGVEGQNLVFHFERPRARAV